MHSYRVHFVGAKLLNGLLIGRGLTENGCNMKANSLKTALESGYHVNKVHVVNHKAKVFLEKGMKVAIFVVSINYADRLKLI